MKVLIQGNVAIVESNLDYAAMKKATLRGPVQIKNDKGVVLYSAAIGTKGALLDSNAKGGPGVCFTYPNKDGKACLNIGPAQCGLEEGKITKAMIEKELGLALESLRDNEQALADAVAGAIQAREALLEVIEVG